MALQYSANTAQMIGWKMSKPDPNDARMLESQSSTQKHRNLFWTWNDYFASTQGRSGTVDKKVGTKLWRQRNTLSEEDIAETPPQTPCFVSRGHNSTLPSVLQAHAPLFVDTLSRRTHGRRLSRFCETHHGPRQRCCAASLFVSA